MSTSDASSQSPIDGFTSVDQKPADSAAAITPGQWRSAMAVLVAVYVLNFLDRQVINILAEPIKQELGLADWQLGMLTGFAFALFYAMAGIPIARLAERSNRRSIIGVAVGVWSIFTILCGFATSYLQMLLFRIGVGVGEAGLVPPANSLITEITPREKLASALAIFYLGLPLGSLLGLAFGGIVADLAGWRMAFILAGAPGLLAVALVFWLLPEPRAKLPVAARNIAPKANFAQTLNYLKAKRSYLMCALAAGSVSMTIYAHQAFGPAFFFRVHAEELASLAHRFGMQPTAFLGVSFGLLLGVFGSVGLWASGRIADAVGKRDRSNYCMVPAVALALFIPTQVAVFFVPNVIVAILLFGFAIFFNSFWFAPVQATVQSVAPKHMRATAASIVLLAVNLIGLGLGPLLLGIISDLLLHAAEFSPAEAIRWAMALMTSFTAVAVIALFFATRFAKADLED